MKVIFVPFIDAFGGVERLALALSRFLFEQGVRHEIACFRDTIALGSFAGWPVAIRELRVSRNSISEIISMRRYLGADRDPRAAPLIFDLKGGFYAGLTGCDYFLHLTDTPSLLPADVSKHGFSFPRSSPPERSSLLRAIRGEIVHRINRRGVRNAKRVFCMTDRIAAEIRELYSVAAEVVRPGVPRLAADGRPATGGGVTRILTVSRLEPNKRVEWILEAVSKFHSKVRLDIVGTGTLESSLRKLVETMDLEDAVTFHGSISDRALDELYSSSDMFAMPAAQGYGLPALEALERQVPAVIHEESGVAEVLAGSPWVEIAHGGAEEFADSMDRLMRRIATREGLGPRPLINSETDWARSVSEECGWI